MKNIYINIFKKDGKHCMDQYSTLEKAEANTIREGYEFIEMQIMKGSTKHE